MIDNFKTFKDLNITKLLFFKTNFDINTKQNIKLKYLIN